MRLLICSLNYAPELTGVGKYTAEMAEWLARRGHEVRVVTAPPYYPAWRVGEGYSAWAYRSEQREGVRVLRCPLWVPGRPSGLRRLAHLASFAAGSLPVLLWQAARFRPAVVLVTEPPLACAPGCLLAAGLAGAASWLHVQDLELEAALGLGLLPSWLRSALEAPERWLTRRFRVVSAISGPMRERLRAKGVAGGRLALFPNWVDTEAVRPLAGESPLRRELGLPADGLLALYSGNMGRKQGLEVVIEAARLLGARGPLRFLLCGEGPAREGLRRLAEGLPQVRFGPLVPAERLGELLGAADVHLLPQLGGVADLVLPSKLGGMLASGRPIVATAAPGTQVARLVEGCGLVVAPGDARALADALARLAARPEERGRLGLAARELALAHWSKETILAGFEEALLSLAAGPQPALRPPDAAMKVGP